jgi:hypothetical protein
MTAVRLTADQRRELMKLLVTAWDPSVDRHLEVCRAMDRVLDILGIDPGEFEREQTRQSDAQTRASMKAAGINPDCNPDKDEIEDEDDEFEDEEEPS